MKIKKLKIVKKHPERIMFNQLPPQVQAQIEHLLMTDFKAAKAVYDDFLRSAAL